MTDKEILMGLECIASDKDVLCKNCSYNKHYLTKCHKENAKDAIELINRKNEEIERLKKDFHKVCGTCIYAKSYTGESKTFKSYVECTNKEHLAKYCKYQNSKYRQRTAKACKCYEEMMGDADV